MFFKKKRVGLAVFFLTLGAFLGEVRSSSIRGIVSSNDSKKVGVVRGHVVTLTMFDRVVFSLIGISVVCMFLLSFELDFLGGDDGDGAPDIDRWGGMQKGKKKQKLRVVANSKRGVLVYFYSDLAKLEFIKRLSLDCEKSVKDTIGMIWKEFFPEEKVQGDRAILAIYRSEGMYLGLEKDRLLGYYGIEEKDKLFLYRNSDVMPIGHYYRLVSLD